MSIAPERIAELLPQTQCQQCGYQGCTPYAQALSRGDAALNLCTPGGQIVINDLAKLLHLPSIPPAEPERTNQLKSIAYINEAECIGCTACIRACPVDAIFGATKQMHTVIAAECTGCELCVTPCPVDCIRMQPVSDKWLPRSRTLTHKQSNDRFAAAAQAHNRFKHHTERRERLQKQKTAHINAARNKAAASASICSNPKRALNPAELIAKAMKRAQSQQAQRTVLDNQQDFQQQQIIKAQQQAAYRRAMRELQYGNQEQKAAALQWLQEYKRQQQTE